MQIHELNDFTGALGSGAYLAIDNGTDTGKISSEGLLAATEARIDAANDQITDLRSETSQTAINIEDDGTDTLFWRTSWENADTWNDGTIDSNIKYRVSSLANISFDKEIVLNISSSFYVKLFYVSGSTVSSRSDWINGKKRIKANQAFRICIKRTSEDSSEKANIPEFVSAITFTTYLKDELNDVAFNLDNLETALKTREKTYTFFWEQGSFNVDGTERDSSTLIRTNYIPFTNGDTITFVSDSVVANIEAIEFDSNDDRIGSSTFTLNASNNYSYRYDVTSAKVRLLCANSGYTAITPAFGDNISAKEAYVDYTDEVFYEIESRIEKFDPEWENGGYNASGEPTTSASQIRTGFIPTGKKNRLLDVDYETPSDSIYWFYVLFDENKDFISPISSVHECGDTVTIPNTASYVRIVMTVGNPTVYTDGSKITAQFLPFTKWYGKKVSVLGDSLSTFSGVSISGDTAYYPTGNVNNIEETWWYRLIKKLGMSLEYCVAYGGSTVTKNNWTYYLSDTQWLSALGSPDLILFCGGTNDIYANMNIGQWAGYDVDTIEADTNKFIPAYTKCISYMQDEYDCPIIALTPCFIIAEGHSGREYCTIENIKKYCDAINEVCEYMGIPLIDTRKLAMTMFNTADYTIDDLHWDCNFTMVVANKLYELLTK